MSLLDLARRWLRPGAKAETDAEIAEEADFRKRAGEVWLAYQNNELWARRKLEAGLALTPEALDYMEREIEARKVMADHDAAIKKEVEAENGQPREYGSESPASVPPAPPEHD